MRLSTQIKPISYLKAHAAEIIDSFNKGAEPLIITQNGEAKIVVQGIQAYEQSQESLALLKILALGNQQVEKGQTHLAASVIKKLRER